MAQLRPDGSTALELTYGDLHKRVWALAAHVSSLTQPGDRVLLLLPAGVSWVLAFWACVVSGRVAVPLAEPRADLQRSGLERLQDFARDADAKLVCVPPGHPMSAIAQADQGLCWLTVTPEPPPMAMPGFASLGGEDLAYLQYTSGSTGQPRGVMVSHANALAQGRIAMQRWQVDGRSRTLCWLPLFHDYGLVSGVLVPFMAGGRVDLYPAHAFMRDPLNWWRVAALRGSTHTGGPHFAFAASLRAMRANPDWRVDLSALRCVSCGAEPIHAQTVTAWWQLTAPMGLHPEAFVPGYGMAETVLGLTSPAPMSGQRARLVWVDGGELQSGRVKTRSPAEAANGAQAIVSCGKPGQGVEVRIVCPDTHVALAADRVGEVWVRGDTVASGYWGQPERSKEVFAARTADGAGPWLRTGDLGFLQDGELCITGRHKDLIIVHGRNVHPQDLEWAATRAHPACVDGGAAAFSVEDDVASSGVERLVLVQEVGVGTPAHELAAIAAAMRASVAAQQGLPLHAVVLVRRGRLPRTSSGKVRRRQTRADWLNGCLRDVWHVDRLSDAAAPPEAGGQHPECDPIEAMVLETWQGLLAQRQIGLHANFFEAGGHSLMAAQAMARLSERCGRELPLSWLFEQPTVAGLSRLIRDRASEGASAPLPAMVRAPRGQRLPASHSQRRMWLVQRLDPGMTAYNIPVAVRLRGCLDPHALQVAFADVCRRHEAFRVQLSAAGGQVWQEEVACEVPRVDTIDARAAALADPAWRLEACLKQIASRPFDLDRPPFHRFTLIRLGELEHVVLWVLHHVVVDHWSAAILWRELAQAYNARLRGRLAPLPEKRFDLLDHAHWQHQAVQHNRLADQLAHWRSDLAGLNPAPLQTDRSWRAGPGLAGGSVIRPLDDAFVQALKSFAAAQGCTPFLVMLACLSMLVARHTRASDVCVATPVANRRLVHAEGIVGTLVNTLAMRNQVAGDQVFTGFLHQVRERALNAWANQDLPFDHLVEALGADVRGARLPLGIEVMLNMPNAPIGDLALSGLSWELLGFERGSTQFPLAFAVDLDIAPQLVLEYASTLFLRSTANRWADQFLSLVKQVISDPHKPLRAYSLMSHADLHALRAWNDTQATVPEKLRADDLVLKGLQAAAGEVVRVPATQKAVGGRALMARVDQIAHTLHARGVRRGDRVGLLLDRDIDLPASMLAVWRTGAAFVPLDPAFPSARLMDMACDAGLALLLTDRKGQPSCDWFMGEVLTLDDVTDGLAAPGDALVFVPPADASPLDAAYLIYTSGSTGRPKGVEVPHRALVNFLRSMAHTPGMKPSDRVLALTTLSFDISLLEILLPLSRGACVVLAARSDLQDGRLMSGLIEAHGVNFMQATPSAWRMLLASGWSGGPPGFKALVGGEPLTRDLAEPLLARTTELWNMYGPTETTVWSTCARVSTDDLVCGIHIGRPIDNTEVWVVDEHGQPCPPGVSGELCIGGLGVANGYWRRAELTAARFGPHPFSREPGARLYRTGDLARWRDDGCIEHLGRMDSQVKLRGHRIELDEVSAVLAEHAGVQQCVACVIEVGPGDARLVAHVVPRGAMPDAGELRDFLRTRLPEYMVPQVFMRLDAVPLLPNGKTDRRSLPVPDVQATAPAARPVSSQGMTPSEKQLARIWSGLLGGVEVSPHDNFFELGGHSLLAMRAVTEIEAHMGLRVQPRQLVFESLAQIASGLKR